MTLSFADASGNLFNRLGRLGKIISQMRSYQSSQNTNLTSSSVGAIIQFASEPDVQAIIGSTYISLLNSPSSIASTMTSVAQRIIDRMIYRDNPRLGQTLESSNLTESLLELLRQMRTAGATIRAQTITTSISSSWIGTGNAAIVISTRRPSDGLVLENAFSETMTLTCTADSYLDGLSSGNETLALTGQGAQSNLFAFDWPLGSDANITLSAIDGNSDNTNGNLLTNSGFEDFTSNAPDSWTLGSTTTAGTHIFDENTIIYDGSSALRITGDGSTLVSLKQTLDSSSGSADELESLTQYSVCLFMRRDGVAAAAGTLAVELVDGNGVILKDANNVDNQFTIDLTGLSTSYAAFTGAFRTPHAMPSEYAIQLRMTVALTNARSVYIDKMSLGLMDQAYTHGPYVSVHAGSTPLRVDDYRTVTITNGRGSGGSLDTWQTLFFRLLPDVVSNELLLPSSATPNISDALITT